MKRFALSLSLGFAIAALSGAAALAAPPNLAGNWTIEQTGPNGTTTTTATITQTGNTIVGKSSKGVGFSGTFVNDSQINGKWNGPPGAGWITVYASPNGHSFNGTWGYNGKKANATFVGNENLPVSATPTAAGTWNVTAAGGNPLFVGPMICTQSGPTSVCKVNTVVINGKFRTSDKWRGTWISNPPTGTQQSGWVSYWFNGDNNSWNGQWGVGADTTPPLGRVVGQRTLGTKGM